MKCYIYHNKSKQWHIRSVKFDPNSISAGTNSIWILGIRVSISNWICIGFIWSILVFHFLLQNRPSVNLVSVVVCLILISISISILLLCIVVKKNQKKMKTNQKKRAQIVGCQWNHDLWYWIPVNTSIRMYSFLGCSASYMCIGLKVKIINKI